MGDDDETLAPKITVDKVVGTGLEDANVRIATKHKWHKTGRVVIVLKLVAAVENQNEENEDEQVRKIKGR